MNTTDILLDQIGQLDGAAEAQTLDVRIGPFWTVVHTSSGAGVASTMAGEARPHEGVPVAGAGTLHERSPLELTRLLPSVSPPEAAVGLAAVNALLGAPRGSVTTANAAQILRERAAGRRVAIIGRFPFVESLRPVCERLWVFERGNGLRPGDVGAEQMPELLPQAEVVAITATTLVNHTLEDVLEHVAQDAWKMMLGPSTPMAPCLFDLGFDVLCGTLVEDVEMVLAAACQGGVTKQIKGVRRVSLWS